MTSQPKRVGRDLEAPPPHTKKVKVESTVTNATVNNFFKPASKKQPDNVSWHVVHETLLFARYRPTSDTTPEKRPLPAYRKIAAFDLDSTLILTKSGTIHAKDAKDWRWWHPKVPADLKRLESGGYAICILTNQGSLSLKNDPKTIKKDTKSLSTFKSKVTAILSHFDFPITLLAATGRDNYRKPRAGMWSELTEELDLGADSGFDLTSCFFVGDAGGRGARGETKPDFSCSDRDMASNVGIPFETPEEHFLGEEAAPYTRTFEPSNHLNPLASTSTEATPILFEKKADVDLVIMCGSPGCGKSTFYWNKLKPLNYQRVNQDTLKTRDKCIQVAKSLLSERISVAVDNTNADQATRAIWVKIAQELQVPIRCVYFMAPAALCHHNATVRALAKGDNFNPENRALLPHSAFSSFASRFQEPKVKEGLQDITRIEFEFEGDETQRRIWSQYWI